MVVTCLVGCGAAAESANDNFYVEDGGSSGDASSEGGAGHGGAGGSDEVLIDADSGRVGIRRLTLYEYDNTVHDLTGTALSPGLTMPNYYGGPFDNLSEALVMTPDLYEHFFSAARNVADDVFSKPELRNRIMSCTPAESDPSCVRRIIEALGLRVWRRPLSEEEIQSSLELYQRALALGETPESGVRYVLRSWLGSLQFLYRIEFDADPSSLERHSISPYELISRLSYLLWSTMPDDELFTRAQRSDALETLVEGQGAELREIVDRMIASEKSQQFTEHFGRQWLGIESFESHQVEVTVFPEWTRSLANAMSGEGDAFFSEFLHQDIPLEKILTHDANFVNAELAGLYGMDSSGLGSDLVRREDLGDQRQGFLGLAVFLTNNAFAQRTAPIRRAEKVLDLLCIELRGLPSVIPKLEPSEDEPPANASMRERVEYYTKDPSCRTCHVLLNPLGLGMENFDAIGRYRTEDEYGNYIEVSGKLSDGRSFGDFQQLTEVLSTDPRFLPCAVDRAFTYALGRWMTSADNPFLEQVRYNWMNEGRSLTALLKQIVSSAPFRMRRGEPEAQP